MLDPTELRLYKSESDVVRYAQGEGFLQVYGNRALLLVDEVFEIDDLNAGDLEDRLRARGGGDRERRGGHRGAARRRARQAPLRGLPRAREGVLATELVRARSRIRACAGMSCATRAGASTARRPSRRIEVPWAGAVAIVCFGVPYRLDGEPFDAFVGGLSDRPTDTEFVGAAGGVQVDFTPLGARRCLGLPMDELTNRVVALEDVLGPRRAAARRAPAGGAGLAGALRAARRGAAAARWRPGPSPRPRWRGRYRRLAAADGRLAVGPLADEVGWSRRHLAARWRRDVGLGPKAVARRPALRARAAGCLREGARSPTSPTTAATPTSRTSTASSARSPAHAARGHIRPRRAAAAALAWPA